MEDINSAKLKKRGSANESYLGKTIDEMIWEFMSSHKVDGLSMAIVQAPYIPRVVSYGFSDSKRELLASTNTIWPATFITQGYTAVAIMQLYERGLLDVYQMIDTYLNDIPNNWKAITILDLLRHSSGISDYSKCKSFVPSMANDFHALIDLVANIQLKFMPGSKVYESATNFLLLTEIIERVSNQSYYSFIKENQIQLLGLEHTGFLADIASFPQEDVSATNNLHTLFKKEVKYINPSEFAASYTKQSEQISMNDNTCLKGYTDLWSSASDISFWDIALAGSILIHEPKNRALLYEPWQVLITEKTVPEVAGWQFYHHEGLMDIKGSVPGYTAYLSRFTAADELVCVTLQANKDHIDFTNLARRIAAAFVGSAASGYNDNALYLLESQFCVEDMTKRLIYELYQRNIPIFSILDHQKNAHAVGLPLRPTTEIIFGSPKVGTKLMQMDQSISISLPLRISMWEDETGSTWIGFQRFASIVDDYQITDLALIEQIEFLLENIVQKVSDIYSVIELQ